MPSLGRLRPDASLASSPGSKGLLRGGLRGGITVGVWWFGFCLEVLGYVELGNVSVDGRT